MRGTGHWGVVVLVSLFLAAWPSAASAQDGLVLEPEWHDFGALTVGTAASATLDVWNDGAAPVTLGDIGLEEDPGPFALGDNGCVTGLVLEPGSGCELPVTFTAPVTRGEHETVVFVEDQAGIDVALARLTGSSFAPGRLVAEPEALEFGVVPVGMTSASTPVTIRNTGDTPLTFAAFLRSRIGGPALGDFRLATNQCVGVLSPGATCGISVVFSPRVSRFNPAQLVREARVDLFLQGPGGSPRNQVLGVSVPVKGTAPVVPLPPPVPLIDYGVIEQDLVRLAEGVPRLLRGGPRRARRLPFFKAPTAGRLSAQIRAVGPGRHMRLATGTLVLEAGVGGRLRFKLGPRARKLLREPRKTRVKVALAFRARATGEVFTQTLELTVRRPVRATNRTKPARASAVPATAAP